MKKIIIKYTTPVWVTMLALLFVVLSSCFFGERKERRNLTVVFYNVENLFDLEDDPGKRDEEFTPGSEKQWTQERYKKKLADLAAVLSGVDSLDLPEIIGLGEVENEQVLKDLANTGKLKKGNYQVVHYESPDMRGIDCALLYRPAEFKISGSKAFQVVFPDDPGHKTRDIIYVKGKTLNNERFHIFVNHWPSRIGGVEKTEPNRVFVAALLKSKIDSVLQEDPKSKVIVMGDMNDEPGNRSLDEVLGAAPPDLKGAQLVNLMYPVKEQGKGSYNYRGNWNMLDNMIVSQNLLDEKGFQVVNRQGQVFSEPWMEYRNRSNEISPNRTYGGPNYYGGVSDHFPVYFRMKR